MSLVARPAGESKWRHLKWRKDAPIYFEGIGPRAYPVRALAAGAAIPLYGDRAKGTLAIQKRIVPFSNFCDLSDFEWPQAWRGKVEIKVSQLFASDDRRPSVRGRLWSGAMRLDMAKVRPALQNRLKKQ